MQSCGYTRNRKSTGQETRGGGRGAAQGVRLAGGLLAEDGPELAWQRH